MSNDPRRNLENILNNANDEKEKLKEDSALDEIKNVFFSDDDVDENKNIKDSTSVNKNNNIKRENNINDNSNEEQNNDRLFDTSDIQPDVLIEKSFDKTVGGLSRFLENIKNNKKYRIKFIAIVCVLIAIIIGYQVLKPNRDEATRLILDEEYTLTKNEKKGIGYMILENEIDYNDYDDFKIGNGYGLINKDNDTMDYCVCKVYLSDYSGTCLVVGDFKEYPAIPTNNIASVDYEDDVEGAVKNALDDEIDEDDYKITRLSSSEILKILGRKSN